LPCLTIGTFSSGQPFSFQSRGTATRLIRSSMWSRKAVSASVKASSFVDASA
jgi:hypothetical protein